MRGCLHKRKTKRGLKKGEFSWSIILAMGRGPDGKHKQKWITFHGTRKQAEAKLAELTSEVHRGEFVEPSKVTLGQWLDEWLDKSIRPPRCTLNTYESYAIAIKKHIKPALGHVQLQALTPLHIERYYADRSTHLAPASVGIQHVILSGALNAAQRVGLLRTNAASRATNKPRVRVGEDVLDNVWTAEEARKFLTFMKQSGNAHYTALFALALDGGMRKGELLGIQWKDIDGVTLRVDRQLLRKNCDRQVGGTNCEPKFGLPKSKRARSIDLAAETMSLLAAQKRQQAEVKLKNRQHYRDHGLVFAQAYEHLGNRRSALGDPLNFMTVNEHLGKFCVRAGVKRITVHGLRHTCATLLLAAGVPPHVVQRRLGHARVEITLNLYAHVLPNQQADAAARLATLLHG